VHTPFSHTHTHTNITHTHTNITHIDIHTPDGQAYTHIHTQVVDAVLANPEDKTKINLVYANMTPGLCMCERMRVYVRLYPFLHSSLLHTILE